MVLASLSSRDCQGIGQNHTFARSLPNLLESKHVAKLVVESDGDSCLNAVDLRQTST